jgi:hypothetical protein
VEKDWALEAYCQIQADRHSSINNLREDLHSLLKEMGNQFISMGGDNNINAKEQLRQAGQTLDAEYYSAIAGARDISATENRQRQTKDYLKPEEVYECEKYRIKQSYGVLEVTEELVEQDNQGRLIGSIAGLEAILSSPGEMTFSHGRYYQTPPKMVMDKDLSERQNYPLCFDWGNYSAQWLVRTNLGLQSILQRLIIGGTATATDTDLVQMTEFALKHAVHIKSILGFTVPENCQPMWLLGVLLDHLGLKLVSCKRGQRGQQVKVYSLSGSELKFALQVLAYREEKRKQRENQRASEIARSLTAHGLDANSSTVSTPPPNGIEIPLGEGGYTPAARMDFTQFEFEDGDSTPIGGCINLFLESCRQGVQAIKGLLSKWCEERRWGVVLMLEEINCDELRDLIGRVPELISWLDESALPMGGIC